jgi:colicin import membrane protein
VSARAQHLNFAAGAFSVLVHAFFMLALVFGVTWRSQPVGPAIAYLWEALPPMPSAPAPAQAADLPDKPPPEAAPKPAPRKAVEPPQPDIALREKELERKRLAEAEQREEQRRLEAKRLAEEQRRKEDEQRRKDEEKRKKDEKRRQEELQRQEEKRRQDTQRELEEEQRALEARRQRQRDEARQQMERDLARQMADELNVERTQMRMQAEAVARGKLVLDFQDRIRLKIRGLLRLPPLPKGNIEVVYRVNLLPNGEVLGRPVLVKSSGVPAYDSAVERAIVSASPLPLPPDKEAAAMFGEGLELKFRPHED